MAGVAVMMVVVLTRTPFARSALCPCVRIARVYANWKQEVNETRYHYYRHVAIACCPGCCCCCCYYYCIYFVIFPHYSATPAPRTHPDTKYVGCAVYVYNDDDGVAILYKCAKETNKQTVEKTFIGTGASGATFFFFCCCCSRTTGNK